MLVFYPHFDTDSGPAAGEVVLLLDTSESMRGEPLQQSRRIALQVLGSLGGSCRLNVIMFGTGWLRETKMKSDSDSDKLYLFPRGN